MGRLKTPPWLEDPLAYALRALAALPLAMPVGASTTAARAAARSFATSRINRKKFPRALSNLADAFPDWEPERVRATAIAAYEHLFQLGVEILYAPRLITEDSFHEHLSLSALEDAAKALIRGGPVVLITGHCGNWELIGYTVSLLGFPMQAIYRPLDLQPLDAWVRGTRERQGLTLVSKFGAMQAMPQALRAGVPVGLVADQSGGDRGLFVPFFGRLTSTYKSIGLLALRAKATIVCGVARRVRPQGPGMGYAAECVDVFGPADWHGAPDPLFYVTSRYRRAMEAMIRRSPEQYLWMHRIWRCRAPHERSAKPFPGLLREKLLALPWLSGTDVEGIVERSDRDARACASGAA